MSKYYYDDGGDNHDDDDDDINASDFKTVGTSQSQLNTDSNKFEKAWEITDLYINMKDWCKNEGVDLLDKCSGSDLLDFVFGFDCIDDNSE